MTNLQTNNTGIRALLAGAAAALLASTCCLGPLLLISLGVSGAWISQLTALEPFQPFFIAAAAIALLIAFRRIWRPAALCAPDQVCALPQVKRAYQVLFISVCLLVVAVLAFPLFAPLLY
jgi:mercuric ion transport protein